MKQNNSSKPAEIYEWPIYRQNLNLPHAFRDHKNPYPHSYKLDPSPGSIILLRSIEDKAFVAIGFVISSGVFTNREKNRFLKYFGRWKKCFYLHPYVIKKFRVRLKNVEMKPHKFPAKISKEDFLKVLQRAMVQKKEANK